MESGSFTNEPDIEDQGGNGTDGTALSNGSGQQEPPVVFNNAAVARAAPVSVINNNAVARAPVPVSYVTSRVAHKNKDPSEEFIKMMRMQMMMDQKERREERHATRHRHDKYTALISSIVCGIESAFGVEAQPLAKKKKKKRCIRGDESSDSDSD